MNPLTGFQGFGFFGDSWLAASTFAGLSTATTIGTSGFGSTPVTSPAAAFTTGTGLTGFGSTSSMAFGVAPMTAGTAGVPSSSTSSTAFGAPLVF